MASRAREVKPIKKAMTTMKKIFSILALLLMTAVGATAQTTYTVTVKDGTEDAANWSSTPYGKDDAWRVYLFVGEANWYNYNVGGDPRIRACLVF